MSLASIGMLTKWLVAWPSIGVVDSGLVVDSRHSGIYIGSSKIFNANIQAYLELLKHEYRQTVTDSNAYRQT